MLTLEEHTSVMTTEIITGLKIKPDGTYIDATFGCGGHTRAILAKLSIAGRVIVIDKDPAAIAIARKLQAQDNRVTVYHGSFANILQFCQDAGIIGKVDGIVLDLGVSSPQLDTAQRGFSFNQDGPLDMRMDPSVGSPASTWLAHATAKDIANVLRSYGEEKHATLIANAILRAREGKPITTTKALADLISNIYPRKYELNKHPATRSFQAIRIFINNELEDLKAVLKPIVEILNNNGRLVVLSFHSLEDRIVKQFINTEAKGDRFPAKLAIRATELQPTLKKIGKAQKPSMQEIANNIRARSAVLRVAEKIASGGVLCN